MLRSSQEFGRTAAPAPPRLVITERRNLRLTPAYCQVSPGAGELSSPLWGGRERGERGAVAIEHNLFAGKGAVVGVVHKVLCLGGARGFFRPRHLIRTEVKSRSDGAGVVRVEMRVWC